LIIASQVNDEGHAFIYHGVEWVVALKVRLDDGSVVDPFYGYGFARTQQERDSGRRTVFPLSTHWVVYDSSRGASRHASE
jgi:hypothetical protein